MDDQPICESCARKFNALLERRIRKILEVYQKNGEDEETGESHCFHLMELQRMIEGKPTCGVYD